MTFETIRVFVYGSLSARCVFRIRSKPNKAELFLEDTDKFDYYGIRNSENDGLMAAARFMPNYNIRQHEHINSTLVCLVNNGNIFTDAGVCFAVTGLRQRYLFCLLVAQGLNYLLDNNQDGFYIQVPTGKINVYQSIGFNIGSKPFVIEGWTPLWVAMYMLAREVPVNYADSSFQARWKAERKVSLHADMWQIIFSHFDASRLVQTSANLSKLRLNLYSIR